MVVNTVNLIEPRITHGNKPLDTSMRDFLNPGNLNGKTHPKHGWCTYRWSSQKEDRRKSFALSYPLAFLSVDDLLLGYSCHCCYHPLLISDQDFLIFQQKLHTSDSPRTLQVFGITLGLIRHPVSWAEQRLGSQPLQHEDSTVILLIFTV